MDPISFVLYQLSFNHFTVVYCIDLLFAFDLFCFASVVRPCVWSSVDICISKFRGYIHTGFFLIIPTFPLCVYILPLVVKPENSP